MACAAIHALYIYEYREREVYLLESQRRAFGEVEALTRKDRGVLGIAAERGIANT